MSKPKYQSCDNCKYQTNEGTCKQWLDYCNENEEERWCQYWKLRKQITENKEEE